MVERSLLSNGVIVAGAEVTGSVLSPGVRVQGGATVQDSILLDDVVVESGAVVRRTVLDKNVVVPAGITIDDDSDYANHHTVSDSGIVVVAKGASLEPSQVD